MRLKLHCLRWPAGLMIIALAFSLSSFHAFYVSICEISHNKDTQSLEISLKIFTDDLEKALQKNTREKVLLQNGATGQTRVLLEQYLLTHLELKVNNIRKNLKYIGCENAQDATWCYIEAENVPSIQKIDVKNSVLTDVYEKQSNIVNVVYNGTTKSLLLDISNSHGSISFE